MTCLHLGVAWRSFTTNGSGCISLLGPIASGHSCFTLLTCHFVPPQVGFQDHYEALLDYLFVYACRYDDLDIHALVLDFKESIQHFVDRLHAHEALLAEAAPIVRYCNSNSQSKQASSLSRGGYEAKDKSPPESVFCP